MAKAVDIKAALAHLPVLRGRTPETDGDEAANSFATLAPFGDGGVFAGSFDGTSEWERHSRGDELVHVFEGEAELTLLIGDEPQKMTLKAGMLTVVPQGCWHRFHAPHGVTLLTVTPQPTDHSTAEDPRDD